MGDGKLVLDGPTPHPLISIPSRVLDIIMSHKSELYVQGKHKVPLRFLLIPMEMWHIGKIVILTIQE